jgi:hypothetical protein
MRCTAHRSRPRPRCRRGKSFLAAAAPAEPSLVAERSALQCTALRCAAQQRSAAQRSAVWWFTMHTAAYASAAPTVGCHRRYDEQRVPPTDGAPRNGEEVRVHMYYNTRYMYVSVATSMHRDRSI